MSNRTARVERLERQRPDRDGGGVMCPECRVASGVTPTVVFVDTASEQVRRRCSRCGSLYDDPVVVRFPGDIF